ncbi:tetratricopeptide repeat protein [Serratia fonticola]|uniref:tetratricopeptide repeat protein n=1 Tax=Serratia fonticola TaxID=47917 RepID=UPI003BB5E14A
MTDSSCYSVMQKLTQLCDNGYHNAAWDLGVETFGPLGEWPGAVGQELACQIALHFGLQRIYQVLVRRGYQRYPNHRPLLIRYGHLMLARRGALYTFEWLDRIAPLQEASVEEQMEWLHFQSIIYTYVRDFTQSQQYADSAARLRPNAPAVLQHNSKLAEMQDRYEEALQIAESGIAQYPDNYLCLKQLTHILTLCGQEARAMSVLQQFIAKTQNVKAWSELIVLQLELKQYQQAIESLDRLAQCLPSELTKLDPSALPAWICAMRCDLACIVGDLPMAQEQGKNAAKHLAAYQNISARLLQAESFLPQKLLDVAFIRQHHKTCAPATLTVIAQYWGEPADHLSIADEICYDGTSHYSERKWAEQQGWLAREFTIDWDSACLLIDKEIPFTLTTTETASAHLQTVIGYSPLRETLICRDPYRRLQVEFEAADLFCSEAPYGIRGMVVIPANQKARLAGVNLPDEALWDALHEVNAALDSHDRPRAANAWLGLRETAPDHLLTLQAERTIASYDSNLSVILNIEEKILERYPDDTRRQLSKASLLRDLKTKREHQQWVEEISRHNPDNPYIRLNLAAQLQQQHASYAESERLLRRVMRQLNAQDGAVWTQFANLRWKQQRRSEALQYYRYASTLQYADESAAESYFQALHCLKQTDSGLSYLQQRHHDLGQYSPLPTITLCEQYERLGRVDEALPLLAGATERHPSDGGLLLFTANMWSRVGEQAKAEALLEQSRPFCNRSQWLQTTEAVLLRSGGGDNQTALALLQEAAELEPLNSNLHNKVTQKLYILHGREKALAWLKTTVDRFPHHKQLNGLYAFWLKKVSDERLETALRHLLVIDPDYQWAIRELAYCLSDGKRFDEAQEILSRAVQLAPNQAETAIAQGFLAARMGSQADAHRCYRQALCLDIDQEYPAYQLISACRSLNERIAEVTFFCQQLQLQNSQGEALLTLQDIGQNSLSPDALLEQLVRFHQQCPELWQSGVAVARQLIKMLRFPEAVAQLEQSTNDFPLLSEIPYELAQICFSEQRYDECLQSLQQVLRLDPWSEPAVKLAVRAHINLEKGLEAAYELLEQSLQFTPESVELIILKGIVLWRQDRPDAAIQALTQAIWLDTGSDWAWSTLQQYARGLDDEHYLYRLSHEIAQQRPNDVDACLALAQYTQVKAEQERALQTVLTLAPRHIAGHEAYLHLLLEQWRYDEMTPHFSTELWGERPPLEIEIFRARQYYRLGQHQLAIEQAQAILSEDPENYNLWRELADWLEQREDWGAFLIAAENMVRLRPESCVALGGYLAAAHHRLGQLQEAKRYYRQALQYEPEYTYALTHFFDLLFQTGAIDEAKALWALQQQHVYLVIGCGLQLAARTQDEALRQELLIERISNNKIDEQCWRESSKVIEELALDEPLIQHITDRLSADRPINTPALLYWLGQHSQYDGLDINLARRHLEQSVAAAPNQKELNAWLIYLLWDQHEGEAALTRLEQVLTQHTDDNWCWARLKEYGEKNEQPLRAYQFAHHLVTQHPNNEHAWLALITLSSDEQKEDIYARFVQLFPRHINGHERYLKLLLEQARFDDMLPYLTITYWGGYIPAVIQVLAANRLVALGQRQEAMSMLESTVQTTPDDRTLWSALADIYRHEEIKNYDGYLYACQQLLRLDPKYYVHFGYVAHAYLLKQDKVAAVPYLEKAIALESNYSFASENLFDIQLENEDFNAAKKTLNIISKYESDGYCGLRMLKLALKIDDKNMLNTGMALILADLEMSNIERHWQTVLTLLAEEKLPLLDTAIENALLERQEAAWVVMNWWLLRHRLSEPQKQVIEAVMQKCTDGKAVLAREVLSSIGNWEDEQQVPYLTGFIQRHGQCLRADAIAHAKVSYAFSSHTHAQEIIDWMSDWQREDIRPWCLSNLLNAWWCL